MKDNLEEILGTLIFQLRVSCDLAFKTKIKMVITEIKIFLIPSNIGNSCLSSCTQPLSVRVRTHAERSKVRTQSGIKTLTASSNELDLN